MSIRAFMRGRSTVRALFVAAAAGLAVVMFGALAPAQESDEARGRLVPHANAVTRWNAVATSVFAPSEGTNPMMQSRTLSILHASIHDAVNAIYPRFDSYTPGLSPAPHASVDAAVAAAAREVLVTLLPDQAQAVETAYQQALADVAEGPARSAGIETGRTAAWANMNRRQNDGAATAAQPPYVPRSGAGEYQFTPPFDFAAQPGWGKVKPFVIDVREHRLPGPQPLSSARYARDLAFIQDIGSADSRTRTAEQSEIARFWYEDSPLGWNRIANTAIRQRGLDAWEAARTLALVNFAMADGFIAGFAEKYRFRFWRPETAIRAAADDGNGSTHPDPAWKPFLVTPPVPDYPSTHTVLGWAAAEVLIEVLGDKTRVAADSLTLPGVTREYRSFSSAAEENGLSRLYAGIHFRHAVRDGKRQGRNIGRDVADALAPLRRRPHSTATH